MFKKIALLLAFTMASTMMFAQAGLSLSATSTNVTPNPWSFTSVTFKVTNNGTSPFYNVSLDFSLDNNLRLKGGDEFSTGVGTVQAFWTNFPKWNIPTVAGGHTAEITLNVFVLGSSAASPVYGQITTATGNDGNSIPGNGTCCTPNEDDEAVLNFNGGLSGGKPEIVVNYWANDAPPNQGGTTQINWRFKNIGTADSPNFKYGLYLSQDQTVSADDILVNGQLYNYGGITEGQVTNVSQSFQLPAGISGQYYVIVLVDPLDEMEEVNENNQGFFRALFINPVDSKADLQLANLRLLSNNVPSGGNGSLLFDINNIGSAAASSFETKVYLSQNDIWEPSDMELGIGFILNSLAPGATQNQIFTFFIPANLSGPYHLIVRTDVGNVILEDDKSNNVDILPIYIGINPNKADLIVEVPPALTSAQGGTVNMQFYIRNQGQNNAPASKFNIFVSADPIFNSFPPDPIVVQLEDISPLMPGSVFGANVTFQLPQAFVGQYYILILADVQNVVDESIENNNQGTIPITITSGSGEIDLEPLFVNVSDASLTPDVPGWAVTTDFLIRNNGSQTAPASLYGLYVSRDKKITLDDFYVGPFSTPVINAGETKGFNRSITFPESLTGDFYLLVGADVGSDIAETNELNNIASRAFKTVSVGGGVDLELEILIPQDLYDWQQWSFFGVPVRITNRGTQAATGVVAEFDPSDATTFKGGDEATVSQGNFSWISETWNVGTIQPGNSAIATINLFRLSPGTFTLQSQITAMNEPDIDSTPGSGLCCFEDDESEWTVAGSNANGVNNRSMIVENLGNQPFAIVNAMPNPIVDNFNLQVYSNEERTSELTIVNALGQPVFRQSVGLSKGHNTIPVELEDTAAGLHSVRMTPFHPHLRQLKVMKIKN